MALQVPKPKDLASYVFCIVLKAIRDFLVFGSSCCLLQSREQKILGNGLVLARTKILRLDCGTDF